MREKLALIVLFHGLVSACIVQPDPAWCRQTEGGCPVGTHCDGESGSMTKGQCVTNGGGGGFGGNAPMDTTTGGVGGTVTDSGELGGGGGGGVGGASADGMPGEAGDGAAGAGSGGSATAVGGTADAGGTDVLPIADAVMDTPPAPTCTSGCNIGDKRCSETAVESCMRMADGCGGWAISMPCASPRICSTSTGAPSCVCQDECTDGARRCSAAGVETCGKVNGCLRWGKPKAFECMTGGRRCDSNGDAQECSSDGASCLAWKPLNKCNNFVCDRGICSDYECKSGYVKCGSECRPLLGACTVDTEHSIQGFTACSYNTGVRRYAKSNTPSAVRDECRVAILDLARTMCANLGANENWQGSWVAFKGNGLPLTGAEQMYGTCTPLAITTDAWDANVLNF
jgi:hypothetical protein